MSFTLRPYQQRAVAESAEFLRFGKGHGLVIVPTGGGKSLVIARITEQFGSVENLTLQATGKRGQSWEVVSRLGKTLTNCYMGDPQHFRRHR